MPKFDEFHNNVNYFTACSNVITPGLYKQLLYCKIAKITLYLILKNNIEGDWKNNGQPWSESFYWPEEIKISFNAYLQASREIQTMLKISTKTLFENPMRPSEQGQFLLDLSLPSLSLFEKNYLMVDVNNLIFTFFTARIAAIKKYCVNVIAMSQKKGELYFSNRELQRYTQTLFPTINVLINDEKRGGYELCLLLNPAAPLKQGKVYIAQENGMLNYSLIGLNGNILKNIKTDIPSPNNFTLEDLQLLKNIRLGFTARAGHTQGRNDLLFDLTIYTSSVKKMVIKVLTECAKKYEGRNKKILSGLIATLITNVLIFSEAQILVLLKNFSVLPSLKDSRLKDVFELLITAIQSGTIDYKEDEIIASLPEKKKESSSVVKKSALQVLSVFQGVFSANKSNQSASLQTDDLAVETSIHRVSS